MSKESCVWLKMKKDGNFQVQSSSKEIFSIHWCRLCSVLVFCPFSVYGSFVMLQITDGAITTPRRTQN